MYIKMNPKMFIYNNQIIAFKIQMEEKMQLILDIQL